LGVAFRVAVVVNVVVVEGGKESGCGRDEKKREGIDEIARQEESVSFEPGQDARSIGRGLEDEGVRRANGDGAWAIVVGE